MIIKFQQFIKESSDNELEDIENLIEDSFLSICDDYDLEYSIQRGYLINGGWVHEGLLEEIMLHIKLSDREAPEIKQAYSITLIRKGARFGREREVVYNKTASSLNKDFLSCVRRMNNLNKTGYSPTHIGYITSDAWQILFYLEK